MCPARKQAPYRSEVLNFTYPVLHTGKKWYVDFTSYDPAVGLMKRKKYHLDGIKKITDRRKRAAELIESLTKLLRQGWSPWINENESNNYVLVEKALDKYKKNIEKLQKYTTRKSYTSNLNTLETYIKEQLLPPKYVYQLSTGFFSDFLDWLYFDREVSARTRNNYRLWCSSLASFFMEREYLHSNPLEKIKQSLRTPKSDCRLTAHSFVSCRTIF